MIASSEARSVLLAMLGILCCQFRRACLAGPVWQGLFGWACLAGAILLGRVASEGIPVSSGKLHWDLSG